MKYTVLVLVLVAALLTIPFAGAEALIIDSEGTSDIVLGQESENQLTKTTQGGNVTITNINTTLQTTHWAAFLGNVTATKVLSGGQGSNIFEFELNGSNINAVAATTDPLFDWGNFQPISGSDADNLLNISTNSADSVSQAFNDATQSYLNSGNLLTINLRNSTGESSDWPSSVGSDTLSPSFANGLHDAAFIAQLNEGNLRENFMGGTAEYQMIVGVNETDTPGLDVEVTYSFWLIEGE